MVTKVITLGFCAVTADVVLAEGAAVLAGLSQLAKKNSPIKIEIKSLYKRLPCWCLLPAFFYFSVTSD